MALWINLPPVTQASHIDLLTQDGLMWRSRWNFRLVALTRPVLVNVGIRGV